MQLDKLYQTSGTASYDFDLTAPFMSIPELVDDMGSQYLMGYCDEQNMPTCCTPIYFNQTASELSFLADYSQNYGFGFARWTYDGGAGPGNLYHIDGDNIVRSWGINYDFSFINRGEMCRVNASSTVEIYINCASIPANLYDGNKCTRLLSSGIEAGGIIDGWFSFSFADFANMIANDTPIIDSTYTGASGSQAAGVEFNITVRPSDFGDSSDPNARHYVAWDAGNGFYVFFCIFGFRMSGNTPVYYNDRQYSANIIPFFSIPHTATGKKSIIAPGSYVMGGVRFNYSNGAFTGIQKGGNFGYNQAMEYVNNAVYGSYNNGTLSVNDIDWNEATLNNPRRNIFFIRNFYGAFLGAGEFRFYSLYTPRDIYNYLCLYHKHTNVPSDNYSSSDTVTVFNTNDSPTYDTMSGSLSEIITRLRPWQIPGVDITSNTFKPEDIPEPTPSGDDEETGDSIIRPGSIVVGSTAGFLTQYVLNAANVAALGTALWSGIGDSNFWQNVLWTSLSASASFDVSSLLQYFISLRVYPFPLINVSTYAGTGDNKLRIGRGAVPLILGTTPNIGTISQYAEILDAGTVTIPRYYNDFRDYSQTTVVIHAPYIGTSTLETTDVMCATLHLVYAIDFAAGRCSAFLDITRNGITYPVCLGSGVMGADVPLTADSASRRASAFFGLGDQAVSDVSKNVSITKTDTEVGASYGVLANPYSMAANAAHTVLTANPITPTMSGSGKGFDSFADAQTAYVQIRRGLYVEGVQSGNMFKSTYGETYYKPSSIGSFSGFTKFVNVDTSGISCTENERAEIKRLLESGVYV